MYRNHFKIALRHLGRNKFFAGINILGLALGLALATLIAVYISHEHSYDNWMEDSENTYRVHRNWGEDNTVWTPSPLAEKLNRDYPQIKVAAGFAPMGEQLIEYNNQSFYIEETAQVDSTFFQVLAMPFLQGDPQTALDQPDNVVITDRLASKLFGERTNPIGKILTYDGDRQLMISGLVDTKGKKSHIQTDFFIRFTYYNNYWSGNNRFAYARLQPQADKEALEELLTKDITKLLVAELSEDGYTPNAGDIPKWGFQPLSEVYLHSDNYFTMGIAEGSIKQLYILFIIGLLVLAVAIINYINLTTARASQRSKEVGVKKVTGAGNGLLRMQFITESVVQALFAGVIALFIAQLALPLFNTVTDSSFQLVNSQPLLIIIGVLLLAIVVGFLAGIYPAFILTAFQPVTALKANFSTTGDKGMFRKILVTSQFAVTITLLIVMAFIYRQVQFMMDQELGFSPKQVLSIPMNTSDSHRKVAQLENRFLQIPGVESITTASHLPHGFLPDWGLLIEGQTDSKSPVVLFTDEGFQQTLNIELVEGRFINDQIGADSSTNFIVNETFVKQYHIDTPLDTRIKFTADSLYGQIVGVVKDFHYQGLQHTIRPLVMNARHWRNEVGIKVSTQNLSTTIAEIEQLWATVEPQHPMRHEFLDAEFEEQYASHQRFGKTILYATLLTLFIALLGLFGLTAFSIERRAKEIGIRKVLGASVTGIVGLLAKDYVKLAVLASVIAIPIGYFLSNKWMEDFAYQTDLAWWVFILAGLTIVLVGFLTVCMQSIKSALVNPVDSLRSE